MKNEVCKIHIPDELVASVNNNGSLVTIEERNPVFQDGDVIWIQTRYNGNVISIFSNWDNKDIITHFNLFLHSNNFCCKEFLFLNESIIKIRLASESEKAKLFDRIKREGYQWNVETKELEPLVELINANKGDYVFIKTKLYSYIAIFDYKALNRIDMFGYYNLTEGYRYFNNSFVCIREILEMRLATNSEIEEFNKQSISQGLMWNPHLKKFLSIPKHGDLCIFYDDIDDDYIIVSIFDKVDDEESFISSDDRLWNYCIPYEEKLYKQLIGFK